jgi:hypothetical protein
MFIRFWIVLFYFYYFLFCLTVVLGKYNKFSDDEDDRDDFDADGKGRSSKGLRVLSLKVKDIVIEKKRTTYKEVATALIKELGGQTKTKSQGEVKIFYLIFSKFFLFRLRMNKM